MAVVAQKIGVHPSTVSRALRNDPSISPLQRERIQEKARDLGYRPDPIVSAYTARVRSYRSTKGHGTIALAVVGQRNPKHPSDAFSEGITAEANAHGFQVERFHLADLDHDPAKLQRVLRTRCIQSLIVMPLGWDQSLDGLDFSNLACAQVGPSLKSPVLPMASTDFFANAKLACAELFETGHTNVGLATNARLEGRLDQGWLGGYLAFRQFHGLPFIPPLFWEKDDSEALQHWIDEYALTAILLPGQSFIRPDRMRKCSGHLRKPIRTFSLAGNIRTSGPGINERNDLVGAAAVRLVIGQLHSGRMGPRESSEKVLIPGIWRDGQRACRSSAKVAR